MNGKPFQLPPPPPQEPFRLPPAPYQPHQDADRDEKGRWLPGGPSPNPKGRPVVLAELRKLARQHTTMAMDRLVEIIQDDKQLGATRVAAISLLLDRGYGKPVQPIETGAAGAFEEMDDSALDVYIRKKARELLIDETAVENED